jgi:hypothetical protein
MLKSSASSLKPDLTPASGTVMLATPAHEAAYASHTDAIRLLAWTPSAANVLDLDTQGAYNRFTALHDAVWHGHLHAMKALVEAEAAVNLRAHTGATPGTSPSYTDTSALRLFSRKRKKRVLVSSNAETLYASLQCLENVVRSRRTLREHLSILAIALLPGARRRLTVALEHGVCL